jgi:hypothetical protein
VLCSDSTTISSAASLMAKFINHNNMMLAVASSVGINSSKNKLSNKISIAKPRGKEKPKIVLKHDNLD